MPVRYVFVGDFGSDVKHNDAALPLDVVTIAKSSKLFLTGSIPHIKADLAIIGLEPISSIDMSACFYNARLGLEV